ncbi:MAG: toll/interleukin-1 receptor domain-containing protein [Marmoricola sp.]
MIGSRVFLSYSSEDGELANVVREKLEATGTTVWIAPRDVPTGVSYPEAIVSAIRDCDAGLLVLSKRSNQSPHVLREVERLTSLGKPLHVLRVDPVVLSDGLAYFASLLQWIEAPRSRLLAEPEVVLGPLLASEARDDGPHQAQRPPASRSRVLPLLVGAALIAAIGGGVAVALTSGGGSGDKADTPTSSGPTPKVRADREPVGQEGLEAVFPGIPTRSTGGKYCEDRLNRLPKPQPLWSWYRQCDVEITTFSPARKVRVTYVTFRDRASAEKYLFAKFRRGSVPVPGTTWLVQYGPPVLLKGGFEVARTYAAKHPFAVMIACGKPATCADAVENVEFLSPDQFPQ